MPKRTRLPTPTSTPHRCSHAHARPEKVGLTMREFRGGLKDKLSLVHEWGEKDILQIYHDDDHAQMKHRVDLPASSTG